MTTEELLKPRYKVIADYPNSNYKLGEVLVLIKNEILNNWKIIRYVDNQRDIWFESSFQEYPYIFKKLAWYAERKVEDMPQYVIDEDLPLTTLRVECWHITKHDIYAEIENQIKTISAEFLTPSTFEEYEQQNKQK